MYLDFPIVHVADFGPLDDRSGGVSPLKTSLVIIPNAFEVALSQIVYRFDMKVLANTKSCARSESHLYQLSETLITYLTLVLLEDHTVLACVGILKIWLHYGLDVGAPACLHGICLSPIVVSENSRRCTLASWGSNALAAVNLRMRSVIGRHINLILM